MKPRTNEIIQIILNEQREEARIYPQTRLMKYGYTLGALRILLTAGLITLEEWEIELNKVGTIFEELRENEKKRRIDENDKQLTFHQQ